PAARENPRPAGATRGRPHPGAARAAERARHVLRRLARNGRSGGAAGGGAGRRALLGPQGRARHNPPGGRKPVSPLTATGRRREGAGGIHLPDERPPTPGPVTKAATSPLQAGGAPAILGRRRAEPARWCPVV